MKRPTVDALFSRTLTRWILAALVLAALLTVARYRAFDHRGNPRVRTAPQVWQTVTFSGGTSSPPAWAGTGARAALAVSLVGAFTLVWCALRISRRATIRPSPVMETTTRVSHLLERDGRSRVPPRVLRWTIAALGLFVAWRLGAFLLSQSDTFASIDHPFHVARAESLRRSLLTGEFLRWVAHHQGGYPVEFYPLGFAYLEVALWGLLFGLLSIAVVHKIAVIILLLAPAVLFWQMARADGRPAIVGFLAFAVHLAVPGSLWEGGFTELVVMGLVTNVAGALCTLGAFIGMTVFVTRGGAVSFVLSSAAAAGALWSNPRSGLGLLACGIGAWGVTLVRHSAGSATPARAAVRLAAVAGVTALLAAPELASLVRYGGLYYFIQYTGYNNSMEYLAAAMNAVSPPIFVFAILGGWVALAIENRPVSRATALTLITYVVMTALVSFNQPIAALVPQLEATRLMPLQRFLTVYLAAVGCHAMARTVAGGRTMVADGLQIAAAASLLLAFGIPFAVVPPAARPLELVRRTTDPAMRTFTEIVEVADRITPGDTAILIAGSNLSTHQPLWAPVVRERPYFYDDWMWYWHTRHAGPYNPRRGSVYRTDRMTEVFSRAYLGRHAIGSVLVAGDAVKAANASPDLRLVFSGSHSLYSVRDAVPFVTFGAARTQVTIANHHIVARGNSPGGFAIVRRNWFPRWKATVNGVAASVERTEDGYMRVPVPAGPVDLRLDYVLEPADWTSRGAAAIGLLVLAAVLRHQRRHAGSIRTSRERRPEHAARSRLGPGRS